MESQIVKWQEMEICAQGIIYTYGLLEEDHFIRIINDCFPNMKYDDLKTFILRRTRIRFMAIRIPVEEQIWWFADSIEDISSWYWAIQDRKSIPYQKYTKPEYMQAALEGLPKEPKNLDSLIVILSEYGISEEEAVDCLMDAAIDHSQTLDLKHGLPEFLDDIEWESKEDLQYFLDLFMEFENDTPLWFNKGNTPKEVFDRMQNSQTKEDKKSSKSNLIEFPKSPNIGRNEPCPCGSGKKYKNCCGRANNDE